MHRRGSHVLQPLYCNEHIPHDLCSASSPKPALANMDYGQTQVHSSSNLQCLDI